MQGLKLSPIDPQGWFRLAVVDSLLKTPEQKIINALRLSFYAGRVEPELLISRLSFAYNYYNQFDKDLQLIWEKQVLVAWALQTKQLITFVALHPEAKQLVEKAFIYSPDDWKKLSNDLEIYLKKNSSLQKKWTFTPPPDLPKNHRVYCIGDIHGRLDLLLAVHQKIAVDAAHFNGIKILVYLGDYIDRGDQSRQVIDCLLENNFPDFQKVFLLGNHEQVLLQFLLSKDASIAHD